MSVMDEQDDKDVSLLAMDQYMRFVRGTPRLTPQQEEQLLLCIERGRQEQRKPCPDAQVLEEARQARERLVEVLQGLVIAIANHYKYRTHSMEFLDVIQEGNMGLLQAIEVSERRTGEAFSGLAGECIRHAILQALYYRDRMVRYPMQRELALNRLRAAQSRLTLSLGRDPSLQELAEVLGVDAERVRLSLELQGQGQVESLHRVFRGREEEEERGDFVHLYEATVMAEDARQVSLAQAVHQAMEGALSPRLREVVRLRYGLEGAVHMQREVAATLGMSTPSIQRFEYQAKARLRERLASLYGVGDEEEVA